MNITHSKISRPRPSPRTDLAEWTLLIWPPHAGARQAWYEGELQAADDIPLLFCYDEELVPVFANCCEGREISPVEWSSRYFPGCADVVVRQQIDDGRQVSGCGAPESNTALRHRA